MATPVISNPWVWDESVRKHRRWDGEKWIYQDDGSSAHHRRSRPTRDNGYGVSDDLARLALDDDVTKVRSKVFRRVKHDYFQPGTVFQCILNQEKGPDLRESEATTQDTRLNRYDQALHTEIRMFVVLWDNEDYSSSCLSIQTYRSQGVAKKILKKENFSIIHSSPRPPAPDPEEWPDSRCPYPMRAPIRVEILKQKDQIDPKSRLNLRAVHCVQQNWRIYPRGRIAPESWPTLLMEHQAVLSKDFGAAAGPSKATRRKTSTTAVPPTVDTLYEGDYIPDSPRGSSQRLARARNDLSTYENVFEPEDEAGPQYGDPRYSQAPGFQSDPWYRQPPGGMGY